MRRFLLIVSIALFAVLGLSAIPAENVNADSILSLLLERGYDAALDADGDVAVYDQYGMEYWIIAYPEENRIWIQSCWLASDDITSREAYGLVNESNRNLLFARCWYEPMVRTFYCDYDLMYPADGLDDDLLISMVNNFFLAADWYTDYLLGEGAI